MQIIRAGKCPYGSPAHPHITPHHHHHHHHPPAPGDATEQVLHGAGLHAHREVERLGRGRARRLAQELHAVNVVVHQQQRRLLHVEKRALQRVQEAVVGLRAGGPEVRAGNEGRRRRQGDGGGGCSRGTDAHQMPTGRPPPSAPAAISRRTPPSMHRPASSPPSPTHPHKHTHTPTL